MLQKIRHCGEYATHCVSYFFIICIFFLYAASVYAESNLISNANFELSDATSDTPLGWIRGRWGNNTTFFDYPSPGFNGTRGARIEITQYVNGDAKWKFNNIATASGKEYEFSDYFKSNIPSYITIQYQKNNNAFIYKDIAHPGFQADFQQIAVRFTVPSGVKSFTVFHLINQVGFLSVDSYELKEVIALPSPPNDPANLVYNPSFEITAPSGLPDSWLKGGWGQNTSVFTYHTSGYQSDSAVRIDMLEYASGDAKWYFKDVPVASEGLYEFSDYYKSSTKGYLTLRFKLSDGTYLYQGVGDVEPSSGWQQFKTYFTSVANAVSLTVFHLIYGVGWLELDTYSLKKIEGNPAFTQGIVSINFDDGWRSMYENVLPILDRAGFKSTLYMVSNRIGAGSSAFISTDEMLNAQSRGHEIGAHTVSHMDLTALSPDQARDEIVRSRNDLLLAGAHPVTTFAYPFGAYNDQIKQMVKDAGLVGARSSDGGFNTKISDSYILKRQSMEISTTVDQVKAYIDKAIQEKTWLILLFHEVNTSGNTYSVTPETFQAIVEYLKLKNVSVVTTAEGLMRMKQTL